MNQVSTSSTTVTPGAIEEIISIDSVPQIVDYVSGNQPKFAKDSGEFDVLATEWNQSSKSIDHIQQVAVGRRNFIFGLTKGGQIYRLIDKGGNRLEWSHFDTRGMKFIDICCYKRTLFAINAIDCLLYYWETNSNKMQLFLENDAQRLRQATTMNKRKIYALSEDGSVLFIRKHRSKLLHKSPSWTLIGTEKMKKISSGSKHIFRRMELWGIGLDDRAYRYDHFNSAWIMYDIIIQDISVTRDDAVYAVSKKDGRLMKWNGADSFVLQDLGSSTHKHHLLNVSAYKESREVYSVDKNGNLLKMCYD